MKSLFKPGRRQTSFLNTGGVAVWYGVGGCLQQNCGRVAFLMSPIQVCLYCGGDCPGLSARCRGATSSVWEVESMRLSCSTSRPNAVQAGRQTVNVSRLKQKQVSGSECLLSFSSMPLLLSFCLILSLFSFFQWLLSFWLLKKSQHY